MIELLIGVTILAVLLALALPSFSEWIRNNHVRVAAETLREGLQLARSEAVKRNTRVRLNLVDSLSASCALSTSGPYWIVNAGASVTPAGSCNAAPGTTAAPYVVQASPVSSAAAKVTVSASPVAVVAFDGAGRMAPTLSPSTSAATLTINVSSPTGTCLAAGGDVRCLRVVVTTVGQVRMCDPSQTGASNPTRC